MTASPLMSLAEIGEALGLSKQGVNWHTSQNFPAPYADLRQGRVWRTRDVQQWAAKNKRLWYGQPLVVQDGTIDETLRSKIDESLYDADAGYRAGVDLLDSFISSVRQNLADYGISDGFIERFICGMLDECMPDEQEARRQIALWTQASGHVEPT